jgi:hypothetical protein
MPPEPQQGSNTRPLVGSEHGDQRFHDGRWREELTAALAFAVGEFADEVLVDAPQQVLAAVFESEDVAGE